MLLSISHEEQREISQKWLSVRYESKVDYRAIWTSLAVFSAILLAAVLWITLLNQQRKALLAARAEAEAANRAKDQFLASMSHELRTPLHAILGYADLIREGALTEPARQDALATIAGSGRHLLSLINDLLDLSRIRSGHLELNPAPVELPALLEEIAAMVRVDAQKKGLAFVLDVPPDLPALVQADGKRIRQILLNLLGNAIKFTDAGQRDAERASAFRATRGRSSCASASRTPAWASRRRTSCASSRRSSRPSRGASASPASAWGSRSARSSRTGWAVRSRWTASPAAAASSASRVLLPVVHEQQDVGARARGTSWATRARAAPSWSRTIRRRTASCCAGCSSRWASTWRWPATAARRLRRARERRPDLIVMDLRMPQMNGFEAARAIRPTPGLETVPMVAASASTADLEHAEADPSTFAACLRKPFQTSDLLDAIQRILGLKWRYAETDMRHARCAPAGHGAAGQRSSFRRREPCSKSCSSWRAWASWCAWSRSRWSCERQDALRPFARRLYGLARRFDEERAGRAAGGVPGSAA